MNRFNWFPGINHVLTNNKSSIKFHKTLPPHSQCIAIIKIISFLKVRTTIHRYEPQKSARGRKTNGK